MTMIIKCKCGEIVVEGEIVSRENGSGKSHKAFDLYNRPNGAIIKNNSEVPKDWEGICSKCQAKADNIPSDECQLLVKAEKSAPKDNDICQNVLSNGKICGHEKLLHSNYNKKGDKLNEYCSGECLIHFCKCKNFVPSKDERSNEQ